jgi:hypothetical protein
MKKHLLKLALTATLFLSSSRIFSQIDNDGCVIGNFGVDGGLRSGTLEFGNHGGANAATSSDWFSGPSGLSIIDISNAAAIRALLEAPGNPFYEARMNSPFLTYTAEGYTLIDAIYARDPFGGTGFQDPSAFPVSSKNGQDPALWTGGSANVLGKNDLLDVGVHMRRLDKFTSTSNPSTVPLFLYGLISRTEPGGSAYMDMEFFIQDVSFTPGAGFTTAGPDMGHRSFKFDNAGNMTEMGDMIVNINLTGGGTIPSLEMRIWVKRSDRLNITPALFNWGIEYDGASNGSEFVYAAIVPKNAGSVCGYVNLANERPAAPPWGHKGTKTNTMVENFDEYALAEFGINLTAFGLDPAFIPGFNSCFFPHKTVCVKTRTSEAFTSALKDFITPMSWARNVPIIASGGVLSCLNSTTTLRPEPQRSDATFRWTTTDGNIVGDPNQAIITVDKVGTYTLYSELENGCLMEPSEYLVTNDPSKPFFGPTTVNSTISCSGSNGTISITATGGTGAYSYNWSGPGGFTSINKNLTGLAPGDYTVVISDAIGCSTTATATVPEGTPIVATPTITSVTCNGLRNGSITLAVTGKSPFTFLWSNGQRVQNLLNVAAGNYSVTITDADGCSSVFNNLIVNQPSALTASVTKVDDTNPDPAVGNGSINLTVNGGTTAYAFSWTGPSGFTANTEDISGLKYGSYSVTVTDSKGCTATANAFIYEPEICNDGIDNDGDGLEDCSDPECIPPVPGTITASDNTPCKDETITYSVVNNVLYSYDWTVPAGATINTGQGTNEITVTWNTTGGGNVCVRTNNVGCLSAPSCITVAPSDAPAKPSVINHSNN